VEKTAGRNALGRGLADISIDLLRCPHVANLPASHGTGDSSSGRICGVERG
jgi:hypothetical protein